MTSLESCRIINLMKKGMTIIYPEYNGLYINLTNRCPCACTFCIRQKANDSEFDNVDTLWLEHEPSTQEVIEAIKAIKSLFFAVMENQQKHLMFFLK